MAGRAGFSMHKVLLLGLFDTAVATARCLKPSGARFVGMDFDPGLAGFSSRLIKPYLIPCAPDDERRAAGFMIDTIREEGGSFIAIPTSDQFVRLLSRYREEFSRHAAFLIPPHESIEMIIRREQQFGAASRAGLSVPEYVTGPVEYEAALALQWPFPIAVKPSDIIEWKRHFSNKGFVVYDENELRRVLQEVNAFTSAYLLQRVVPGDTSHNFEVNSLYLPGGRITQHTIRKLRQFPDIFGTATCIESFPHKQLEDLAAGFIQANELYGFTNLEFKYSVENQVYYYIETNIRAWLQVNFSKSMGVNFVRLYCDHLSGKPVEERDYAASHKKGKWVDFLPDVLFWIRYRKKYGLSLPAFLRSWLPLRSSNLFSLSDPWPFLRELKLRRRLRNLFRS